MTSLKSINRRVGSLFAVAALVLATVTPGLLPAFASAAQITERSVELSNSSKEMDDVSYKLTFTTSEAAGAAVFDFCANTPLFGAACTAPAGFDVSTATADNYTVALTDEATTNDATNAVVVTGSIAAGENVIMLEGVTNPDEAKALYVRIATYGDSADAADYVSAAAASDANVIDSGSIAASITDTVGVSGAVLESLTFCVSGEDITGDNCTKSGGGELKAPTLKLGETVGDVTALTASAVSEGSIYSQLSTNAANGAVVNIKSDAEGCGGLLRFGSTDCNIGPATDGIEIGSALFGLKIASATSPTNGNSANSSGTIQAATGSSYGSDFLMNFAEDEQTGVTSPFGDPLLDTNGAPVSNKNMQITFGASVANNTPAGLYSADLSLIATGKF